MGKFDLEWMKNLPVTSIPLRRPGGSKSVLILESRNTAFEALSALVSAEILSAPVWDSESSKYIGSMDMFHIVNLISETIAGEDKFEPSKLIEIIEEHEVFRRSIKDLFHLSSENTLYYVTEKTPLLEVAKEMVKASDKFHKRALVFREGQSHNTQNLVSIVSQAAIISLIGDNRNKLGSAINSPMSEYLRIDWEQNRHKVVSISGNANMLEAINLMSSKSVSGLAVIDDHGQLLGTVATRDIKGLIKKGKLDLSRLRLTVREYMNYIKQLSIDEKHPAISVKKTDTMATLIGKFASTHVHRIFVIDEHGLPVGVISTIDLLKIIVLHS